MAFWLPPPRRKITSDKLPTSSKFQPKGYHAEPGRNSNSARLKSCAEFVRESASNLTYSRRLHIQPASALDKVEHPFYNTRASSPPPWQTPPALLRGVHVYVG